MRGAFYKGSSDQSHFIFGLNVGKSRIRRATTQKLNDEPLDLIKNRSMSDPILSGNGFTNEIAWALTTLDTASGEVEIGSP